MKNFLKKGLLALLGAIIVYVIYILIAPSSNGVDDVISKYDTQPSSYRAGNSADIYNLSDVQGELGLPAAGSYEVSDGNRVVNFFDRITLSQSSNVTDSNVDRKIITQGNLNLIVEDADSATESITKITTDAGGLVLSKNLRQVSKGVRSGYLTISIPESKLYDVIEKSKDIAVEVQSESVTSEDVTEQYIDTAAHLANMKAEEAAYQRLLEQTQSIDQTLKITKQLTTIRTQIDATTKKLNQIDKDSTFSTVTIYLTAEQQVEVLGIRWKPLVNAKIAFRDMVESLASTIDILVGIIIYLPVFAIWFAVFSVVGYFGAKLFYWIKRKNDSLRNKQLNANSQDQIN